jgi:hypothetical protein
MRVIEYGGLVMAGWLAFDVLFCIAMGEVSLVKKAHR